MRALSNDIITKSAQQNQTIAAEAEPCVSLRISRNNMELTNMDLVEKIRVRRTNANTLTDADVAVQHPVFRGENTKVWVAYIHDGSLGLRWAYDTENLTDTSWNVVSLGAPSAVACALVFNSDVVEGDHGYFEYVTSEDYPLVFYVDTSASLHCITIGATNTDTVLESGNVTDVTVIRGSASVEEEWDYGLTVFYLKSGNLYYRQFMNGVWNTAGQVNPGISGETLSKIDAFVTKDRRVGLQILTSGGKLYQIVTSDEVPEPDTWVTHTWSGNLIPESGQDIWSYGTDVFYSYGQTQYVLDKRHNEWKTKSWNGELSTFYGRYVWTDGEDIYYSNNLYQYIMNKTSGEWEVKTWDTPTPNASLSDYIPKTGNQVWTDGKDMYWSGGSGNTDICVDRKQGKYWNQLKLNKSENRWSWMQWRDSEIYQYSKEPVYGENIWTDGNNIYYSDRVKVGLDITRPSQYTTVDMQYLFDKDATYGRDCWSKKTWSPRPTYGKYVWTDGVHIFYGNSYILDKTNITWISKTWNGYAPSDPAYMWSDGRDIYYSNGNNQYKLQR